MSVYADYLRKEVMFSSLFVRSFVCLLAALCKTTELIFTKFGGKASLDIWKKLLHVDYGGNPCHVTLRFGVGLWIVGARHSRYCHSFVGLRLYSWVWFWMGLTVRQGTVGWALAEVYALLSAILVFFNYYY